MIITSEEVAVTGGTPVDLLSLEDAKEALAITGTAQDDFLESYITRVSGIIATLTNRILGRATMIETFVMECGEYPRALQLSRYPIVEVDSVVLDDEDDPLDVEKYVVDKDSGLLHAINGRWSGTVVVNYTGGYDLPDDAPDALVQAAIMLVKDGSLMRGRDPTVRSVQHGDESVSFWVEGASQPISPAVSNLIEKFRRL